MRTSVFERISKRTPEQIEESRQRRKKQIEETSLEEQLGYFVGEFILHTTLPTLSCDMFLTKNVIQVSEEETNELNRLSDIWLNKRWDFKGTEKEKKEATKEEWEIFQSYNKTIEEKYYPPTFQTFISPLNVKDMDKFKDGLIRSLWNCDVCSYSLKKEDIMIETDENYRHTIITLKR
jgi:hypothetical protein